jgi:hypothetical protein
VEEEKKRKRDKGSESAKEASASKTHSKPYRKASPPVAPPRCRNKTVLYDVLEVATILAMYLAVTLVASPTAHL